MNGIEPLEQRLLACAWAPHAAGVTGPSTAGAGSPSEAPAVSVAGVSEYDTPFITDAQLVQSDSMTAAEIRAFLASRGSYFRQAIADVDGVVFDPATVIATAAAQYRISPKVILATLQKEHSGVTRTGRPTDAQMRFLMGCVEPTTARHQLACAAERFRSYDDDLRARGVTVSGWRVGVAKTTQDGVVVTPANRAVAGQFTYTPYAGAQWGGNRPGVGGVYLFANYWRVFGFTDSTRPAAAASPVAHVTTGGASFTFTVTFTDAQAVDVSDIVNNHNAVRVTGPNGFDQPATFVSLDIGSDGVRRIATYRLAAPGGSWDAADAGAYTVRMREAQVSDINNNFVPPGAVGTLTVVPPATVVGRHVFYNQSAFDGGSWGTDPRDEQAIAPDKVALRPGQAASAANVTSYSRGVSGIMVDLRGQGPVLSSTDFSFRVGNGGDPSAWAAAPPSSGMWSRTDATGFTRVWMAWPDGAVRNGWLQVTVKATANTRLAAPDVFYFGNLAGNVAGDDFVVGGADVVATRAALSTAPATLASRFDHNRDGRVDIRDVVEARSNMTASLYGLGGTAAAGPSAEVAGAAQVSLATANSRRTGPRRVAYVLY